MLGCMEPGDGELASHQEPNGSVVIKVSASYLLLLHTHKAPSGFSLRSAWLKSDLVPSLSAFPCSHRRSNEEGTGERAAEGAAFLVASAIAETK